MRIRQRAPSEMKAWGFLFWKGKYMGKTEVTIEIFINEVGDLREVGVNSSAYGNLKSDIAWIHVGTYSIQVTPPPKKPITIYLDENRFDEIVNSVFGSDAEYISKTKLRNALGF